MAIAMNGGIIMSENKDQVNQPETQQEPEKNQEPEKKVKFSYFEPVAGIIFALVASIIFYFFPQVIAVGFFGNPIVIIPTFVEEVIKGLWLPIFLWAILRIIVEIVYLVERRYTKRLAIITIVGNLLAFVSTLFVFIPDKIVNPEYIGWVHDNISPLANWFGELLAKPHWIIIAIMLIGLILDSITVTVKGIKASKKEKDEDDDVNSEAAKIDIDNEEAGEAAADAE